jgi:hypothetical protein
VIGDELVIGSTSLSQAQPLQARALGGSVPLDMLAQKTSIPLGQVTEVRVLSDLVRVSYHPSGQRVVTAPVHCKDSAEAEAVLTSLHQHLGPRFERIAEPMSRWTVMGASLVILILLGVVIAFVYDGAVGAAEGVTGFNLSSSLVMLVLRLLTPNGVLCLGGILLLMGLMLMLYLMVKPPMITKLVLQAGKPGESSA